MSDKTSVSNAEIGSFWDEHDTTEFGEQTDTTFEVNIKAQRKYYALDNQLSLQVKRIAEERGISEETRLNLWVHRKIAGSLISNPKDNITLDHRTAFHQKKYKYPLLRLSKNQM